MLREVTLVTTGGLGVAANGQEKKYEMNLNATCILVMKEDLYNYTSGVKMVSTKTSRDVGMVPLSSSCMEKPTGGKSVGAGRGIP